MKTDAGTQVLRVVLDRRRGEGWNRPSSLGIDWKDLVVRYRLGW